MDGVLYAFLCMYTYMLVCVHLCVHPHGNQKLALGVFLQPTVFGTECFTDPEAFQFSYSGWPVSPSIPTCLPRDYKYTQPHPDFFIQVQTSVHACIKSALLNKPSLISYACFQRHFSVEAALDSEMQTHSCYEQVVQKEFEELMSCIIL